MGQKCQQYSLCVCQSPERVNMEFCIYTFSPFFFIGCFTSYCYTFSLCWKTHVCHTTENSYIKLRRTGIFKVLKPLCFIIVALQRGNGLFLWTVVDIWWAFRILLLKTLKTILHFHSGRHMGELFTATCLSSRTSHESRLSHITGWK